MNRNMKISVLKIYDYEPVPSLQQMEYAFDCDHAEFSRAKVGVQSSKIQNRSDAAVLFA